MTEILTIVLVTVLVNNLALIGFPDRAPAPGSSSRFTGAAILAIVSAPVIITVAAIHSLISDYLLQPPDLLSLYFATLVLTCVLASLAATHVMELLFPLAVGNRYLLLLLVGGNSAALGGGLSSSNAEFSYSMSMAVALGNALGFAVLLLALAAMRERLELADVPSPLRGPGLEVITAGLTAMALLGFAGAY